MPAVAHQQRLPDLGLELPDLLGQRGLADEQLGGCAAEVQLVGDRDEVAHQAQVEIHAATPSRSEHRGTPSPQFHDSGVERRTALRSGLVIDRAATGIGPSRSTRVLARAASPGHHRRALERGPRHAINSDTRRVHPRSVAARHQLGPMDGAVPGRRLRADRSWLAERAADRRGSTRASRARGRHRHRRGCTTLRLDHRAAGCPAGARRPLLRRPARREAARGGSRAPPRSPSTRPRSRGSCRCRWRSCGPASRRSAIRPTVTVPSP